MSENLYLLKASRTRRHHNDDDDDEASKQAADPESFLSVVVVVESLGIFLNHLDFVRHKKNLELVEEMQ